MPERLAETLMDLWTPLIILWITLPTCVYMAPMNQAYALTTGSPLELSRQSEELRILNRSKRGWVWNQMFVLEEFSGPEPILVGRVTNYLDFKTTQGYSYFKTRGKTSTRVMPPCVSWI